MKLDKRSQAIEQLERALPLGSTDPHTMYNVACAYGLLQMKKEALDVLRKAGQAGFSLWDLAARDPDLACIHGEKEFKELIEQGKPAA